MTYIYKHFIKEIIIIKTIVIIILKTDYKKK